ncbi:hypothetical protein [Streptomyces sp. NPDC018711]|uniref:hypothetical protein n=1 Tax=Streptomyces sp. NPDC018711 TaxID=3365052 RepID=UPI00378BF96C
MPTARTTIDRNGVLIVLQIPNMRSQREVAETLVHELVHAHQLGDRSARGLHLDYLNHVWGQQPMTPSTVRAYELPSQSGSAFAARSHPPHRSLISAPDAAFPSDFDHLSEAFRWLIWSPI